MNLGMILTGFKCIICITTHFFLFTCSGRGWLGERWENEWGNLDPGDPD